MNKIRSYKVSTSGRFSKLIIFMAFVVTLLLAGSPAPVFAVQGGGPHYVGGNEDFFAGALPPPGFYPILYHVNYTAGKVMDNDGNDRKLNWKLDVNANAFRFVYVSKYKLLGADLAWHAIVPVVDQTIKVPTGPTTTQTFNSTGLGDIEFSALILGWHFSKNLHLTAALDVMAPTGAYDKNDPSSIGLNYWTIAPILAATYITNGGFEVSGKFQYFYNTENTDLKYTSGNELLLDYLVGQHIGDWKFGVNGVIYKQITDDEANGVSVKDNLAQNYSVGPAIQYNYKNIFINAKYQVDTRVRNLQQGEKLWIKFMYAF